MLMKNKICQTKPSQIEKQNQIIWSLKTISNISTRCHELERLSKCPEKNVACIYLSGKLEELAYGINGTYWDGTPCGKKKVSPGEFILAKVVDHLVI